MIIELLENDFRMGGIIDDINRADLSTQFFQWLVGEELDPRISFEVSQDGKFIRTSEYFAYGIHIFSGGGEFLLNKMSRTFCDAVQKKRYLYYELLPELTNLKKFRTGHNHLGSKYTVFSEFSRMEDICGACWEMYDLENLLKIYRMKFPKLP